MMLIDKDTIEKINFFENITRAKVKEFIEREDKLIFIVYQGDLRKVLGKEGKDIKTIENLMHKRLKIIEFDNNPLKFVRNFIYPVKPLSIDLNNNYIEIKAGDRKSKGLLIGRESKNLDELNKIVKNYYNLQVKVI